VTDTDSTGTAEDWEAVAQLWIEYGEHQASYAAYLELQIQGHLDEIEELKDQNGKLTADNKRQAESLQAYRQSPLPEGSSGRHRIDHLTFTDLPQDEQHRVTARIQRQAEQDLQERLQQEQLRQEQPRQEQPRQEQPQKQNRRSWGRR
jgi:hypothetical protein